MRVVISSIQQYMKKKIVSEVKHVTSADNVADVFTKKGVSTERILTVIDNGTLIYWWNERKEKIMWSHTYLYQKTNK